MEVRSDFLVIGSGGAGLTFALKVADFGTVALVTKKGAMDSNTAQAQGGIASVFGSLDSFDLHIRDIEHRGSAHFVFAKDMLDVFVRTLADSFFSFGQKIVSLAEDGRAFGAFLDTGRDLAIGQDPLVAQVALLYIG